MLEVSIVIPAYNEKLRLPSTLRALLEAQARGALVPARIHEILIVDDGSRDGTLEAIPKEVEASGLIRTFRLEPNHGKGAAIRKGLAQATGEWVLIADADQATPWNQLAVLAKAQEETRADIVIGSRGLSGSQLIRRQNRVRETLGKLFNRFIVMLTGLPFKDTQCGFKLMRRSGVAAFLYRLRINRFAWDVEFLMRARRAELSIIETPVVWSHQEGSKIRPFRDGLRMVVDFALIRFAMSLDSDSWRPALKTLAVFRMALGLWFALALHSVASVLLGLAIFLGWNTRKVLFLSALFGLVFPGTPPGLRWLLLVALVLPLDARWSMDRLLRPDEPEAPAEAGRWDLKLHYDGECGVCRRLVVIFSRLLDFPLSLARPAQLSPAIFEVMERENSWVLEDAQGKLHLRFEGVLFLLKTSGRPGPRALAWIAAKQPFRGLGTLAYRGFASHRATLARLVPELREPPEKG